MAEACIALQSLAKALYFMSDCNSIIIIKLKIMKVNVLLWFSLVTIFFTTHHFMNCYSLKSIVSFGKECSLMDVVSCSVFSATGVFLKTDLTLKKILLSLYNVHPVKQQLKSDN